MSYIPEPITRIDKYLAYIAGNMDVALPDYPITRKEHYLAAWAEKSGFEDVDVAGEPPLTLENAIGKPLKGLRIYGKSTQKKTTGAQLLNLKDEYIIVRDGVTIKVLDNGCLFVDGTPQDTYTSMYDSILSLSAGDYYFFGGNDTAGTVYGQITISKPDGTSYYVTDGKVTIDGTEKEIKFTIQNGNNTERIDHYTLYTMLNAGSTPLPWESYTGGRPSPSPDYPQEIESVGMKWSTGANLLDISQWKPHEESVYGLAITIENDIVTLRGTYTRPSIAAGTEKQVMFRFISTKTYTQLPDNAKVTVQIIKSDGAKSMRISNDGLKERQPSIIIAFYAVVGDEVEIQLKPMIYVGDTAPEWEPYTGGVPKPYGDKIGVNVHGKNLIPFPYPLLGGAGTKTELNGVKYIVQADGGIRCVGTPNSVFGVSLSMIVFSDKPLSVSGPTDGKVVLSGGPLYFDPNNKKLFFFFDTKQVGNPIDTIIYPQIEIGTVATPYEPYHEPQFASIATPNGLPGIPVSSGGNYTDVDSRQWICDEIDFGRGMYVQNIKVSKSLNDLSWHTWGVNKGANGITGFYTYDIDIPKIGKAVSNIARYNEDIHGGKREGICASIIQLTSMTPYMILCVRNDTISDISSDNAAIQSFKEMLAETDAYMMYVLAAPIETPLTSDQLAAYKQLHTYKGTTIIDNDAGAYMSVKYEKMK